MAGEPVRKATAERDPIMWYKATRMAGSARARAKKRGEESELTAQYVYDLLCNNPHCPICGVEFVCDNKGVGCGSPTLDRIRNDIGYTKANVAMICFKCNALKRNASAAELRAIHDWIDHEWALRDLDGDVSVPKLGDTRRLCKRRGCGELFAPEDNSQVYHNRECRKKAAAELQATLPEGMSGEERLQLSAKRRVYNVANGAKEQARRAETRANALPGHCEYEGCEKLIDPRALYFCTEHYEMGRDGRRKALLAEDKAKVTCKYRGCKKRVCPKSRCYCIEHFEMRQYGRTKTERIAKAKASPRTPPLKLLPAGQQSMSF